MSEDRSNLRGKKTRASQRYGYVGRATVRGPHLPDEEGVILDLSLSGCLIGFDRPVDVSPGDMIEVHLRSAFLGVRALGCVRRLGEDTRSVGFSFEQLTSRSREDLGSLIEDLDRRSLARKTGSTSNKPSK